MSSPRLVLALSLLGACRLAAPALAAPGTPGALVLPPGEITRQNYIYTAKLTTLISALPDLHGKSFVVRSIDKEKAAPPGFKAIADHVAEYLKKRGMTMPKAADVSTDYVVWLKTTVREINPDEFALKAAPAMRFAKAEARDYERTLIFLVSDPVKSTPDKLSLAYQGFIMSTGPNPRIRGAMPGLLQIFFAEFPGKAGETKKYPNHSD